VTVGRIVAALARRLHLGVEKPRSPWTRDDPAYARHDIGPWTYGRPVVLSARGETSALRIGRFCSIAEEVTIMLGGNHRVDWVTTYPFNVLFPEARGFEGHPMSKGDVVIGNDVWIGTGALVLSGVIIGNGAVVGARSVVSRSVPGYAVAAGNPARVVRSRFTEEQVDQLERLAWWDWPLEKIREAWPLLLSSNIQAFLDRYGSP
jgi:virginiamycin A acetyltransferase